MTIADFNGGDADVLYDAADHKRVKDLFSVQRGFMKFMGQIPIEFHKFLPSTLAGVSKLLANFYSAFLIGETLHLALLFYKTTYDMLQQGDLQDITDAMTSTIIYSFACFATCYWRWHAQRLLAFMERINSKYRHHSLAGLSYVSAHPAYMLARKMTIYWQFCCMFGVTFWAMVPLILGRRELPLRCWYPFDEMRPVVFELMYVLQSLAQVAIGATYGNGSALFVSLVCIMLGQFDVLFCSLKNLDNHASLMSGADLRVLRKMQHQLKTGENVDELNQYIFGQERATNLRVFAALRESRQPSSKTQKQALHDALVECVHLHRFIVQTCQELEELFNPYCLIKSLQITGQLCLLVFVAVTNQLSAVGIISLIQYVALTLFELLMFCYCGELLRGHSLRIGEAFWRSEWWQHAYLIRNDVMIFLVNTQRAVVLTAGKFYAMDVQRLRSVVGQAFSFLTLLQKIADKN